MRKSMKSPEMSLLGLVLTIMMVACNTDDNSFENDVWEYPIFQKETSSNDQFNTSESTTFSDLKPTGAIHYKVINERPFSFALAKETAGSIEWTGEYVLNLNGKVENPFLDQTAAGDVVIAGTFNDGTKETATPIILSLSNRGAVNYSKLVSSGGAEEAVLGTVSDKKGRQYVSVVKQDEKDAKYLYLMSLTQKGELDFGIAYAQSNAEVITCDMNPSEMAQEVTIAHSLDRTKFEATISSGKIKEVANVGSAELVSKEGKPLEIKQMHLKLERIR